MNNSNIFVTKPSMPDLNEFIPYLEKIWSGGILTNNGPFHQELEAAMCDYLQVPEIALFSNGTVSLVCALQALKLTGDVITTPFSFVATAHAISWQNLKPIFVDIDPVSLNMDPNKIEAAITPRTSAILPVHCYGNPCDTAAILDIANRHNLKVLYDAAHAFGVNDAGGSVLRHGDMSSVSFHATKVFNTFEGGAIVCQTKEQKQQLNNIKNFGITGETSVESVGINGKMSEINAAFGLVQMNHIDRTLDARTRVARQYQKNLAGVDGITVVSETHQTRSNWAYFPVLVGPDYSLSRDQLYDALQAKNIFSRKYFSPLLSNLPMYRDLSSSDPKNLPTANAAGGRILCLPIYPDLADTDVKRITDHIVAWA